MDMMQKQKIAMLAIVVILSATAVQFMKERIELTEIEENYEGLAESNIHNQEIDKNTETYNFLKNSKEKVYIHNKQNTIEKDSNITIFYSIYNEHNINSRFEISNIACNDGNTVFFNPDYESYEKMVIMKKNTKIFPLRIYYPKGVELESPRSFSCKLHVNYGMSEYDTENFMLILKP